MASGWSPIASHQINVDLAAGETKTFIFVLGYIENPEDEKWESYGVINKTRAKEMLAKYQTDAQVDEAFAALQAYWKQLLARYTVDSADEKSTVWSTPGTSISVWLLSTCPVPLPITNPESAVVWVSVIPVRICSVSYI